MQKTINYFTVNRSPKDLKLRLVLNTTPDQPEQLPNLITQELQRRDEVQIIDLSNYDGPIKTLIEAIPQILLDDRIILIIVAGGVLNCCKNGARKLLLEKILNENPQISGSAKLYNQSISLPSLLNFDLYINKLSCKVSVKRMKLYAFRQKQQDCTASSNSETASDLSSNTADAKTGRKCHICHQTFSQVTASQSDSTASQSDSTAYKQYNGRLCIPCSDLNFKNRSLSCNLTGKYAIVTGGRIKIGYETVLKLLRDGCTVVATTRFADDAMKRYENEPDYDRWKDRIRIYELDLRDLKGIYKFTDWCKTNLPNLDILINNAAQTIDRPDEFYRHLKITTQGAAGTVDPQALQKTSILDQYFPTGLYDSDGQQLDLRRHNSWIALLGDVPIRELLTVFAINAVAPFILVQELYPLMIGCPTANRNQRKFVINVSAMEGQFSRVTKTERHPHTNMAKAALNMFTRTTGLELQKHGIYMTAVDTGWVMDERPHHQAEYEKETKGFVPPLDAVDGASRVYHPIVEGLTEERTPHFAVFLKNYNIHPW